MVPWRVWQVRGKEMDPLHLEADMTAQLPVDNEKSEKFFGI